jgi:phage regulator Rha-like protein
MFDLTLINNEGNWYADSRQVADMVGKDHKNLLQDIDGYVVELGKLKVQPTLYFQNSSYIDKCNRTLNDLGVIYKKGNTWYPYAEIFPEKLR